MDVYLKHHAFTYDVGEAVLNALPSSPPVFREGEIPAAGGDYLLSSIDGASVTALCRFGGREESATAPFSPDDERSLRHAVKKSIYLALSRATGTINPWGALTGVRPTKFVRRLLAESDEVSAKNTLRDDYFVTPERTDMALACARFAQHIEPCFGPRDVLLYVGIPFCKTRCRYCSFVSHSIEKAGHLIRPYLEALGREIKILAETATKCNLRVRALYIGGGTPTTLSARELSDLLGAIRAAFPLDGCLEYTLEAGRPDTLDAEKLSLIARSDVTRVSINPQSMQNDVLRMAGRPHTAEDVEDIFRLARDAGLSNINMDLICGLPGDTPGGFRGSLARVLALRPENVTVHTLALKKGADLNGGARGAGVLPPETVLRLLDDARSEVDSAGYLPYYVYRQKYMAAPGENVGYMLPGRGCVYNSLIMEETVSVLSIGAGGITKLTRDGGRDVTRMKNHKFPYEYGADDEIFRRTAEQIRRFYETEET